MVLRNSYAIEWVEIVKEKGKEEEEEQMKKEEYDWDDYNVNNDSGMDDVYDLIDSFLITF